ncbi:MULTISPECIES: hypothetical protein [Bacillaceae]|uniref:Uncharacterized protein n=3 Tax=Bacillaceae TaxID=186817 RepID=A0A856M7P3_9BACI|nr:MULTISPECIES: hypothetical protein [Bacillaceae]AMK74799.1 hypothetical protein AWV81_22140 [Bacillus subtilis subsp. natto]API45194.1 hypothetical protein BSR08_22655 [Bacillus subtilis]ASB72326.1 hypothetical protein S100333_04467 [Bacillus subtilis subsp. subtilis]AVL07037.1 hypothetical protein BS21228_22330 [Bacillus subtilis]AYK80828.1 hypothetical protein D9C20_22545 [Bacillus subtilis subsp. subtilis]
MGFDALSVKKKNQSGSTRKLKKIQKSIDRINRVYPVCGYTDEGYVKTKFGLKEGYFEVFDVKHYDTNILDEKEFNFVTESYWKLQQIYSDPLKEVHMNLPEDNQLQQEYIKYKIERTNNFARLRVLNAELEKLKFIEKTYKSRRTYLIVFGRTAEELTKRIDDLTRFTNFLEPQPISIEKKIKILHGMNNFI